MANLDALNEQANKSFQALKERLSLNLQKPIIDKALKTYGEDIQNIKTAADMQVTKDKFDANCIEAAQQARFVDQTFKYIDGLELPPNLSLVVGLLISANKTNSAADFKKASDLILKEVERLQV